MRSQQDTDQFTDLRKECMGREEVDVQFQVLVNEQLSETERSTKWAMQSPPKKVDDFKGVNNARKRIDDNIKIDSKSPQ